MSASVGPSTSSITKQWLGLGLPRRSGRSLRRRVAGGFANVVERADVWMIQRRECPGFALEPRHALGVGREQLGKNLDRDVAIELRVARPIDITHSARANGGEDFIWAEPGADAQHLPSPMTR